MLEITKLCGNNYTAGQMCMLELDGTGIQVTILIIHPPDGDGLIKTEFTIIRDRIGSRFTAWQGKIIEGYCQGQSLENWWVAPSGRTADSIKENYLANFAMAI